MKPNVIEVMITLSTGDVIIGNKFQVVWLTPFSSFSVSLDKFTTLVDTISTQRRGQ